MQRNIGFILLGIFLILYGISFLASLPMGLLLALLAILAGVFVLIGR